MKAIDWAALIGYGVLVFIAGSFDSRLPPVMLGALVLVALISHPNAISTVTKVFTG